MVTKRLLLLGILWEGLATDDNGSLLLSSLGSSLPENCPFLFVNQDNKM